MNEVFDFLSKHVLRLNPSPTSAYHKGNSEEHDTASMTILDGSTNKVTATNNGHKSYLKTDYHIHECIIFLIQGSSSMFTTFIDGVGNKQTPFLSILNTLNSLMKQLIITLPSATIGCYLTNCTEHSDSNTDNEHETSSTITDLIPIGDLDIQAMKKLNDLIQNIKSNRVNLFERFVIDKNECPLEQAFSYILPKFTSLPENEPQPYNKKKLFFFTDIDKPLSTSKEKLSNTLEEFKENQIEIIPFFISHDNNNNNHYFDPSKFYFDILHKFFNVDDSLVGISPEAIKNEVMQRKEVERIKFSCPLELDVHISVGIKGLIYFTHEYYGTKYKYVHRTGHKEVHSKRIYLDPDTEEEITDKIEQVYPLPNGVDYAKLDSDYIQQPDIKGLKILSFYDIDDLLVYHNNIDNSSFIIPNDETYKNSSVALGSLYRIMEKLQKCAIVYGKLKRNSNVEFFIMTTKNAEECGFYLNRLPYRDEIRLLPPTNVDSVDHTSNDYQELLLVTKKILENFNLEKKYEPTYFSNPKIQKHYKVLHDFLLQVEYEDPNISFDRDDTVDEIERINYRISNNTILQGYIEKWYEIYNRNGSNVPIKGQKTNFTK
ncbi:ATP-dependent DNA helicase YKU70 SCDLUD_001258 [Saccharomycodes ludwigii]|uniref:ATP-dependent DNA helicase YKU70 n=1 Tax=Saccharomycodes ludwigii TaxID=36035 RepID=UPI001E898655|nr:hypothetical protein SCDLUD_001258 [Saccharomycodes ludwigii]KAH3903614.1 hypothetical protein SCDLUD_001258 [Saccharomycodes ludwigii]